MSNIKIASIFILPLVVACVFSSGCTESAEEILSEQDIIPYHPPEPEIKIAAFNADTDWSMSAGFYADCTVDLINLGEAAGIATIRLETNEGEFLSEFDVYVPPHETAKRTVNVDISRKDIDTTLNCTIVNQSKA